ncbi:MAG: LytTR family DNA-binding domain-containing protein [Paludibacter sp.]|nr:LytTR family DNA-binding domain-containing protein [Paludibacter sp.]
MRCLAIDDEPLALQQISSYIDKTPFLEKVALCQSAFDAMEIIENELVHLLFVDINMPDLNGMDFIKSLSKKPQVIFTTAYSEYAIEGFQVDAIDYLLKPINYNSFLKAVNKAKTWFELTQWKEKAENETDEVFVKSDYKVVKVRFEDILYVESANEYIKIYIDKNEPITTLMRLKIFEEQLPVKKFMRIHRSFIVNIEKISAIDRNRIYIGSKTIIPVGEQYKETFQKFLHKKMYRSSDNTH